MEIGVPKDSFDAVLGLGYDHEFHVPDISPDGALNGNVLTNPVIILGTDSQATVDLVMARRACREG